MGRTEGPVLHLVVMGVSGAGKSAVGRPLAERLGMVYAEGDDFHPQANIDKMTAGTPLDDTDRWPWLEALAGWTRAYQDTGQPTVVACSALRRSYRDVLRAGIEHTWFVHLHGDEQIILQRMRSREHFMGPEMLRSQLATLEPLTSDEQGFVVDIAGAVDEIVETVVHRLPGPDLADHGQQGPHPPAG